MASSLEQRIDGSVALYIDGDLQFDSNDEHIYHEALTLPSLAITQQRLRPETGMRVLIIGGGDGLAAREILKSARIISVDLVDYDPEILALANSDLLPLNQSSLLDARVTTHIRDAWEFVDEQLEHGASFDLIVSDLTVADSVKEARFHSVDWYGKLNRLLSDAGVVAVNAVSPMATPKAYWSVFNSMLKAGLHARPYHINIPSFSALGYGQDWGFLIASSQPITISELNAGMSLIGLNLSKSLKDEKAVHQLFLFPDEVFAFQGESAPAMCGSDVLLRYFNSRCSVTNTSGAMQDSFSLDTANLTTPDAESGRQILSPELCAALAESINADQNNPVRENSQPQDVQLLLNHVMDLMPSLEREQTAELITDFLQHPEVFLSSIDLPGLVRRLLRRAAELPATMVTELELLRDKLEDWSGDQLTLVSLGSRIVTVLTLTLVIGNLLYPDMAYAKDSHGGHAAGHAGSAGHADGHRGSVGHVYGAGTGFVGTRAVGVYGNRYWNGTRWLDHRPNIILPDSINSLPQRNDISDAKYQEPTGSAQSPLPTAAVAQVVADVTATRNKLVADKAELAAHMTALATELNGFEASEDTTVGFGSHSVPRAEAIRLTQLAFRKTQNEIEALNKQIASLTEQGAAYDTMPVNPDQVENA